MRKFLRKNWIEILAILGVLIGLFVVLQRSLIRQWYNQWMNFYQNRLSGQINEAQDTISEYAQRFSMADLTILAVVVLLVVLVALRIRHRVISSPRWKDPTCPRCGSDLHRVHRSSFDRLLSRTFLPHARRYLCKNSECRWTGLKNIEHGRRRHRSDDELTNEEFSS
jgi:hypothetical protein